MKKRILAILLTFAMLVSLVPTVALATEEDTVPASEILAAAAKYVYDDYNYTGNIATSDSTVYYTIEPSDIDGSPIMNDLARFLGALWRFDEGKSAKKVTYNSTEYTWVTEDVTDLKGSNWRDESKNTLVSAITTAFASQVEIFATTGSTLTFKLNNEDVTINLIPMKGLEATGTKDTDYKWEDNSLIILKNGVTVSGATSTQNIVVDEDVTSLTLNDVEIIPTENQIELGINGVANSLTITLVGYNQLGNTVIYSKGTEASEYADATKPDEYLVKKGIEGIVLTFTGEGNLTIYDREQGIKATNVTFDKNFSGTVKVEDFGDYKCAINASGDVSLLGGTFNLTSYKSNGIYAADGSVIITDATVTINSGREELDPGKGVGKNGIYVEEGNVTISGEADVASGGQEYGIYVEKGDIVIGATADDAVQVFADGYEGGIKTDDGDITINAGTVKARSHKWGIGVGTTEDGGSAGNITISGNKTEVVAFGGVENNEDYKYGCGIYAVGGNVTIKDGAGVIAKGYDYGIGAEVDVKIQGATTNVNAEGGYSAPGVATAFANDDSGDDIYAYGIFAKTGTIKVQGGTVVAHGCDGAMNQVPDLSNYKYNSNPSAAILGGNDAASAVQKDASDCTSVLYAEIFSKILKEELSVHAQKNEAQIDGKTVSDAKLACYGITYDKKNKILTLDGLIQTLESKKTNTTDSVYAIKLPAGITIVLNGENTITAPKTSGSQKMACGIFANGALTIKGDDTIPGTLTISGGASSKGISYGIYAAGDLSIDGDPTMNVNGSNGMKGYGIYSKGNATISSGTISAMGNTAAVAVDTDSSKTLTVGAAAKTATLTNATANSTTISKSNGVVTGGALTSTVTNDPVVISFDPVIVVEKKTEADYPVEGEENAEYQLYTVSAENFAPTPSLALQWKNGDAWDGSVPNGVTLDTDGKITTTTDTVAGDYIFRITNGENETIDTPEAGTPNPAFVSSGEITLTITEAKAEGECTYEQKITTPVSGETYQLKLNFCDKGKFTFTKNGNGWDIQNSDGKYLTMKDGKLVLSDTAFAWTYKNGAFSTTVKTTQKTSGTWFLFWYIPGSTKTVTTTYYLSTVTDGEKLSTYLTCAELYQTVTANEHDYKYVNKGNGTHDKICKNCGENTNESCVYDQEGNKCVCGAYDPACKSVDVSATYKTKTQKHYVGFWPFGYYKNVTTYTATVKVNAEGLKVTKVEVSANQNKGWTVSNTFTSNSEIEQFYVRVTTNDGAKYLFRIEDGIGYPAN